MYPKVNKPVGVTLNSLQDLGNFKHLFPEKSQQSTDVAKATFVKKQQSS